MVMENVRFCSRVDGAREIAGTEGRNGAKHCFLVGRGRVVNFPDNLSLSSSTTGLLLMAVVVGFIYRYHEVTAKYRFTRSQPDRPVD